VYQERAFWLNANGLAFLMLIIQLSNLPGTDALVIEGASGTGDEWNTIRSIGIAGPVSFLLSRQPGATYPLYDTLRWKVTSGIAGAGTICFSAVADAAKGGRQ